MSAVTTEFTFADLERMPEDGMRREILHGELIELPPPKLRHEDIASMIHASLVLFIGRSKRGRVFGSGMGYRVLSNDRTWLQPDVSFLLAERLLSNRNKDYVEGSPELAVEVISSSESAQDVADKIAAYFSGGAHAVIVVYPKSRSVELRLSDGTARVLHSGDVLSIPALLPGWELAIDELFAD